MEYNKYWTKEINQLYRRLIKEGKSIDEIKQIIGEPMNHHPKGKFKYGKMIPYKSFLYEIKFFPKEVEHNIRYEQSYFFKNLKNIIIEFTINNNDYIILLESFIEDNDTFKNKLIYNISFTTNEKYLKYKKQLDDILKNNGQLTEYDINNLKIIFEKETNYGDIIKIFNSISYILIMLSKDIIKNEGYCIYMIGKTDNELKIDFYKKSIESSFKNYKLSIDYSKYFTKMCYYYEI